MIGMHSPRLVVGGKGGENDGNKKSMVAMRGKLEKTEERLSDFRDKLKEARAELASRDRQLDVAKRMLSRLGDEKRELESAAELGRTAARKMEARLHASGEGQDAAAKMGRLRAKVAEQKDDLRDSEARCLLAEEAALKLSQEVSMLRRALGMKDSLADGALDSQTRLLHQLALAQEGSTSLALALSEREIAMQSLEDEVEGQRAEIGRLQLSRAALDAELDDVRQTVAESVETSVTFRREAEMARAELARCLSALEVATVGGRAAEQEAAAQGDKARTASNKVASMERASRLSLEALRCEVTLAVERAESRAAEQRATWGVREATLTEQLIGARRDIAKLQDHLLTHASAHKDEVKSLRARCDELEDTLDAAARSDRSNTHDIGRLHGQVDTFTELNLALRGKIEAAEADAAAAEVRANAARADASDQAQLAESLSCQVEMLQAQLQAARAVEARKADAHAAALADLRDELSAAALVGGKVQGELLHAKQRAAESMAHSGDVDNYVTELHRTVESLTESKAKLQSHMLDQVSIFKAKLQRAEDENRSLRAALGSSAAAAATAGAGAGGRSPHRTGYGAAAALPPPPSGPGSALYERARAAARAVRNTDDEDEDGDMYASGTSTRGRRVGGGSVGREGGSLRPPPPSSSAASAAVSALGLRSARYGPAPRGY